MKKIIPVSLIVVGAFGFLYYWNQQDQILTENISYSTDLYSISAAYPDEKWDAQGTMKLMVDYLVNQKRDDWKNDGVIYKAEQELAKKFPDRPRTVYELNITYATTTSRKLSTRSYLFQVYEFTGGAHGRTAITTYNLNKKGLIKIEDLIDFGGGNYIALAKIIKAKLINKFGENANERMINDGLGLTYLKPDNTIDKEKCNCEGYYFPYNVQYFTVMDQGINFIFSQYQVGAYALGMPEVLLTWEELKPFLNKDNPLGF